MSLPIEASFNRRTLLKGLASAGALSVLPRTWAQLDAGGAAGQGIERVVDYLERHARADEGYAFEDQLRSHLTPTFAVVGSYRLLNREPPRRANLTEYVRTHHPRELKKLEQERRIFEYQQVQALVWLDGDTTEFRERIADMTAPLDYLKQYERHGYPIFQSEMGLVQCHALLGLPLGALRPAFTDYVVSRRRPNGTFNNTPAADGSGSHVMNTWWGLQAAGLLGQMPSNREATISWLQQCQQASGGFIYQPNPAFGGVDDVAYTRAALRALQFLGGQPLDRDACLTWLFSLANADGGFGDREGWQSNPLATYYALDALDALGASGEIGSLRRPASSVRRELPGNLRVFSIQIEAHGTGSPTEAVALAQALKIDLWGAKNAKPEWLDAVRQTAAKQSASVQFFRANEEYGTWVDFPGMGTYSHTSDIVAPEGGDIGPSLGNQGVVSWPEFRTRRLDPLHAGAGRLIWQFGENEELVRMLLDDSMERGGFAAISTFHFGNPDFTNTEPFLQRWRGQIPFIGLQDAHGGEPWWFSDMTTGFRTLFLATEPTWEGWLRAMENNWVVAVRHDAVSRGETWMHSGSNEVRDFVNARQATWRWWDNTAVQRPMGSLVILRPDTAFEEGCPVQGLALRVRCAWTNSPQGVPLVPLAELVELTLDGKRVSPRLVEKPRTRGEGLGDVYHLWELPHPAAGNHVAIATVRELATGNITPHRIEFEA